MAFSKGRTAEQSYIEDTIEVIKSMVCTIPQVVDEKMNSFEKKYSELAKEWAEGDEEIEISYRNQFLAYNPFEEWNSHFYESFVITTYSFYEKSLKMLLIKNNLQIPEKSKGNYAKLGFKSLREYIEKYSLQLNSDTYKYYSIITGSYSVLRNYLVHQDSEILKRMGFIHQESGVKFIDDTIVFKDNRFLIKFLDMVKYILLDINEKLEQITTR